MAFTPIAVTGSFVEPDGSVQTGRIIATLSGRMVNTGIDVEPEPVVGELNTLGELKDQEGAPFVLLATDDAGTDPQGQYYVWQIELDGSPIRTFHAPLPSASPSHTVDLSALDPDAP